MHILRKHRGVNHEGERLCINWHSKNYTKKAQKAGAAMRQINKERKRTREEEGTSEGTASEDRDPDRGVNESPAGQHSESDQEWYHDHLDKYNL
jgi:hypothetical protein